MNSIQDMLNQQQDEYSLQEVLDMVNKLLKSLPILDKTSLRKEMSEMTVSMSQDPTTADLNRGLALSQGFKDRLSEIYISAYNDYKIKKRCLDMLFDANNFISRANSVDKRKGESTTKFPTYIIKAELADMFLNEVDIMYKNMKSISDSISRQVTIMTIRSQINDFGVVENDSNNSSKAEEITNGNTTWDKIN